MIYRVSTLIIIYKVLKPNFQNLLTKVSLYNIIYIVVVYKKRIICESAGTGRQATLGWCYVSAKVEVKIVKNPR